MSENRLSIPKAADILKASPASVFAWKTRKYSPSKTNEQRMRQIMASVVESTGINHSDVDVKDVNKIGYAQRFVRVAFKVQTLTDVLEKARLHGSVSLEDGDDIFTITKLGK